MLENKTHKHISILLNGSKKITIIAAQMYNTGVIFVRMCNTADAAGLMPQYYCSTASTANFTAVLSSSQNRVAVFVSVPDGQFVFSATCVSRMGLLVPVTPIPGHCLVLVLHISQSLKHHRFQRPNTHIEHNPGTLAFKCI